MCMFTDGSDIDIHAQIAREDAEQVAHRPGLYYVLVKPWAVYVKEGEYFKSQGGLTQEWGKNWRPVHAESIADARSWGKRQTPDPE